MIDWNANKHLKILLRQKAITTEQAREVYREGMREDSRHSSRRPALLQPRATREATGGEVTEIASCETGHRPAGLASSTRARRACARSPWRSETPSRWR